MINYDEFIFWFTQELRNLKGYVGESEMFEKCRQLVDESIDHLEELSAEDRTRIYNILMNYPSNSYQIGDYQIPYDEREEFDFIEEVLGTLEAYLRP